jgi:hypothetical protein
MTRTAAWFVGALLWAASGSVTAEAAKRADGTRNISFRANPTRVTVGAGKQTQLDMLSWIQGQGSKPVFWQLNPFQAPRWVQIDEGNNRMVVNPPVSAVGIAVFSLIASTGGEDTAIGRIEMTVRIEPIWNEDRIDVGTAPEDEPFTFNLAPHVTVPGGGPVTFTWEAGGTRPAWLALSPSGVLSGTPRRADVGNFGGFFVVASTPSGGTARAEIFGVVTRTLKPPRFLQSGFTLPNAFEKVLYTENLNTPKYVSNFENVPLTFTKIQGPAWLGVTPSGVLQGTPGVADVGPVSVSVKLEGTLEGTLHVSEATFTFNVQPVNDPPVWTLNPVQLPDAPARRPYTADLKPFATDEENDPLTFSIVSGPQWATVSPQGLLTGTPPNSALGQNSWVVRVSDGALTAETTVQLNVVNTPPRWKANPVILPNGSENVLYQQSLAAFVEDDNGDTLTFTLVSGPPWATVSPTGTLTGTPRPAHLGQNRFTVRVSDGVSGQAVAEVRVFVEDVNDPPSWTQSPIVLDPTDERVPFSADLSTFVVDPDVGDLLTFEKVTGPEWAAVSSNGLFGGTPLRPNVGLNVFRLRVSDRAGASAEVDVFLTVNRVNQPPQWTVEVIPLPDATEDSPFSFNIATFATDEDGDRLTFRRVAGPQWLAVAASGALSGTPASSDVGDYLASFEVSDGKLTRTVPGRGRVLRKPRPPVLNVDQLVFTVKERAELAVNLNDPRFVVAQNGLPLTFELVDTQPWVSLLPEGPLVARPQFPQIGRHELRIRVADALLSAEGLVTIIVERDPRPPVWNDEAIVFETPARTPFSFSVANKVRELDGVRLTFSKKSGPSWLNVTPTGELTGTAPDAAVGDNPAVVTARNDSLGADKDVIVKVLFKNNEPKIQIAALDFTVKERARLVVGLADPKYVLDEDGDPLEFALLDSAQWVSLDRDGTLTLTPRFQNIGVHEFAFRVTDGTDTVEGKFKVTVERDPRPPVWTQDPIVFETKAREPFSATVRDKAIDLDGLPITYAKAVGPDWLTVTPEGTLSGVPSDADIGDNTFFVSARNDMASADATVIVRVLFNNHPPEWKQDPIDLPDATVGEPYTADLAPFAQDPDPDDRLTFSLQNGPSWLQVAADGKVSGTPALANVGVNTWQVRVADPGNKFAVATVRIRVIQPNSPPRWSEDPIRLADARAETPYMYDVSSFALDDDGDTLTFRKVSGPNWLQVGADGKLGGTPTGVHVGDFVAVLEVTDNKSPAVRVNAVGRVLPKANPPVIKQDALYFTVKERATLDVDLDQKKYVEDLDNLPLSFELVDVAPWVSLSQRGRLLAQPFFPQIGDHQFRFRVTNHQFLAEGILHIKVIRDPRPPVWTQNPIRFRAKAREPFSATLADNVTDPDGLPITFAKKFGAAWLSVDERGNIFGTPQPDDVGENTFLVTAKNDVAGSDVTVIVFVENNNNAPFWTQSPIRLPDARIDVEYLQTVEPFAKDPDPGDKLTFRKLAGPDWVFVGEGGTVLGKPSKLQEGVTSVRIRITDPWNLWADVTVIIHVTAPAAPRWLKDPIPLGDVRVGNLYGYDISPFAVSDEGLPLTFSKVSGPGWLQVLPNGRLAGRPAATDVGPYTAVFAVSDGRYVAQATGYGRVLPAQNSAPVFEQNPIRFTMKERETLTENLNQRQYLYDPDGDPITMELLSPAEWTSLTAAGVLTLRPLHPHIGEHTFTIRVSDDKGNTSEGKLYVRVLPDAQAPLWIEDPIRFTAYVNRPFLATIADKARDPDGKQLAFGKVSGPEWLVVAGNGGLSGLPVLANLGENTFRVFARNDARQSEATVIITVLRDDPITDSLGVDDAVPGAPVENLWVVDNSWCGTGYSPIVNGLRSAIRTYFSLLEQARVEHVGAYLSSDARTYDGRPLRDPTGAMLFFWKDTNLVDYFVHRLLAPHSGYCYSSPLWAMYRFQRRVTTEWPFYKKDFVRDRVPQDVLIATIHPDYYSYYTRGRPEQSWNVNDFVGAFLAFSEREKQSFRVSVVAPQCKSLATSERQAIEELAASRNETVPVPVAAPSAYSRLVDRTKGEFLALNCQVDYNAVMRRYAQQVIFRAYVHAKQRVALSKKPLDSADIEVRVGGRILERALWRYDASSNAVEIDWMRVDVSALKPGDRIEIRYRA